MDGRPTDDAIDERDERMAAERKWVLICPSCSSRNASFMIVSEREVEIHCDDCGRFDVMSGQPGHTISGSSATNASTLSGAGRSSACTFASSVKA